MEKRLFGVILLSLFIAATLNARTARDEAMLKTKSASIAKKNAAQNKNTIPPAKNTAVKSASNPYEIFASANDLLEAGKYAASIQQSQKAAALFKNFSAYENGEQHYYDCLTQIGEAYLRAGKVQPAQLQFLQTFDLAPQNKDMLLGIAAVYFRLQKYSEGKEFFEAAIKKYKGTTASNTKNNSTIKNSSSKNGKVVSNTSKNGKITPTKPAVASNNDANTAAIVAPLYHYYAVCLSGEGNFENALYAIQASKENYLRAGKTIPPEVQRFYDQNLKNLNAQERGAR